MEQHVPSRLVSSIYRLAPPSAYSSKEEEERRLKVKVRRLLSQRGAEAVVNMIRRYPVSQDDTARKAWLILTAYAEDIKGHRQGSI